MLAKSTVKVRRHSALVQIWSYTDVLNGMKSVHAVGPVKFKLNHDDNVFYTVQILTTRWVTILRCTYETRSALR
jgi:hypothetical protein